LKPPDLFYLRFGKARPPGPVVSVSAALAEEEGKISIARNHRVPGEDSIVKPQERIHPQIPPMCADLGKTLPKPGPSADNRDPETYSIIGAALEVHRELGHGFLEAVYQGALAHEFALRKIPFLREKDLPVFYRETPLPVTYRADFVCYMGIIVELKALAAISGNEEAQVINYLKASRHQRGLLFNFGAPSLQFRSFIFTLRDSAPSADPL
jgi:GxxExxY protein